MRWECVYKGRDVRIAHPPQARVRPVREYARAMSIQLGGAACRSFHGFGRTGQAPATEGRPWRIAKHGHVRG